MPVAKKPVKGHMTLYLVLLVVVLGVMWLLRSARDGSGSRGQSAGDTVDVAIQYAPLSFYTSGDTLAGFNYDLIRALGKQGGITFKFHPIVTLRDALDGLDDGLYDIVVADMAATADITGRYSTGEPVYTDRLVLVQQRRGDTLAVSGPLGLAGREVWAVAGSPAVARFQNLSREIGDTIIVRQDSLYGPEQLFILAATGEIPVAAVNERTAARLIGQYPDADISVPVAFNQFQTWLMREDEGLLRARVDSLLTSFKQTAAYDSLCTRYLK